MLHAATASDLPSVLPRHSHGLHCISSTVCCSNITEGPAVCGACKGTCTAYVLPGKLWLASLLAASLFLRQRVAAPCSFCPRDMPLHPVRSTRLPGRCSDVPVWEPLCPVPFGFGPWQALRLSPLVVGVGSGTWLTVWAVARPGVQECPLFTTGWGVVGCDCTVHCAPRVAFVAGVVFVALVDACVVWL